MRRQRVPLVFFLASFLLAQEARGWDPRLAPTVLERDGSPGLRGMLENRGDHVHNCGNLQLNVTNFGLFGSLPGLNFPFSEAPSAQWPASSGVEYLFGAGLWIGAVKGGKKVVTTAPNEFLPGLSELDRIYETRELAPGGARAPSPNADDDGDGRTDEDWLDGRDNDGDGRIDEDFAAISNEMFFCEYSDVDPNIKLANPEHEPIGFLVQQTSMCWEELALDDFIAFDFRLINSGHEPVYDVYVGFFADCDIGPRGEQIANDDYAGFWEGVQNARLGNLSKRVKISIGYMFDDDGDEGRSLGYIGLQFLGAQDPGGSDPAGWVGLHNFRFFSGDAAFEQGGDPNNDDEAYRILDGTAPRSLPPPAGLGSLRDPALARRATDYRLVVSAGPFPQVDEGDTLGFQAALVLGRGFEGMLANAVQAQLTYDGVWLDCDENPTTGMDGREQALCGPTLAGQIRRIDPCDSLCDLAPQSDPNCYVTVPADGCEWVNGDCELERWTEFLTGVGGKECLIHWLVSTAPPPPRMRVVAAENRVDLLWDNLSETTPDLRFNIYDFESYRIWRADNWRRPLGTDERTGPGANLWMLLAEFDLPDNDTGSDTGLESIRYEPSIPAEAVQFYREWFESHPFLEPPDLPGLTQSQIDTAIALSQGTRYYRYTDPPLKRAGCRNDPGDPNSCETQPCPQDGHCPPIATANGLVLTRCNERGMCQETAPPPHAGAHYFYSVTATDHKVETRNGLEVVAGPGLAGDPNSNFVYLNPPTAALAPGESSQEEASIYVVPNPATPQSLDDWRLQPNNQDPSGKKVEFHHLPRSRGSVSIYTLAADLVIELPFDATSGNGSLAWDLISRNGQEITSGVYLFVVEAENFDRFVGRFVVVR